VLDVGSRPAGDEEIPIIDKDIALAGNEGWCNPFIFSIGLAALLE
jgi:hypothetical protein